MTEQQKEQWKKESEQLKNDLNGRSKLVQKREVELSFGTKKNNSKSKHQSDKHSDDHLRQSINWG